MNVKSAKFIVSNQNAKDCPKGNLPEYAFIGRSNVGKSSLINMLTNNKKLANQHLILLLIWLILLVKREIFQSS